MGFTRLIAFIFVRVRDRILEQLIFLLWLCVFTVIYSDSGD